MDEREGDVKGIMIIDEHPEPQFGSHYRHDFVFGGKYSTFQASSFEIRDT
jgi:hypothetical protein